MRGSRLVGGRSYVASKPGYRVHCASVVVVPNASHRVIGGSMKQVEFHASSFVVTVAQRQHRRLTATSPHLRCVELC